MKTPDQVAAQSTPADLTPLHEQVSTADLDKLFALDADPRDLPAATLGGITPSEFAPAPVTSESPQSPPQSNHTPRHAEPVTEAGTESLADTDAPNDPPKMSKSEWDKWRTALPAEVDAHTIDGEIAQLRAEQEQKREAASAVHAQKLAAEQAKTKAFQADPEGTHANERLRKIEAQHGPNSPEVIRALASGEIGQLGPEDYMAYVGRAAKARELSNKYAAMSPSELADNAEALFRDLDVPGVAEAIEPQERALSAELTRRDQQERAAKLHAKEQEEVAKQQEVERESLRAFIKKQSPEALRSLTSTELAEIAATDPELAGQLREDIQRASDIRAYEAAKAAQAGSGFEEDASAKEAVWGLPPSSLRPPQSFGRSGHEGAEIPKPRTRGLSWDEGEGAPNIPDTDRNDIDLGFDEHDAYVKELEGGDENEAFPAATFGAGVGEIGEQARSPHDFPFERVYSAPEPPRSKFEQKRMRRVKTALALGLAAIGAVIALGPIGGNSHEAGPHHQPGATKIRVVPSAPESGPILTPKSGVAVEHIDSNNSNMDTIWSMARQGLQDAGIANPSPGQIDAYTADILRDNHISSSEAWHLADGRTIVVAPPLQN